MFNRDPFLLFLFGVAVVALIVVSAFAITKGEAKAARTVDQPKVGANSNLQTVQKRFNANFTGIRRVYNEVGWAFGDEFQDEESLLAFFEVNTPKERKAFFTNMLKSGGKRVRKTCYNLYSSDHSWSLGYCTNREAPIPIKEKA